MIQDYIWRYLTSQYYFHLPRFQVLSIKQLHLMPRCYLVIPQELVFHHRLLVLQYLWLHYLVSILRHLCLSYSAFQLNLFCQSLLSPHQLLSLHCFASLYYRLIHFPCLDAAAPHTSEPAPARDSRDQLVF